MAVLIIFPVFLQTIINLIMLSNLLEDRAEGFISYQLSYCVNFI